MRWTVLLAYAVLYVVWGSTYLAMKIAVTTLPPFVAAFLRFVGAGFVLFVAGRLLDRTPITRRHVLASALQAVLLLVMGNAAVMFAMREVPSGVGSLLVATTPMFVALWSRNFHRGTWAGIALGLLGVGILVDPWSSERAAPLGGTLLLLAASASWGLGAVVLKLVPVHPSNATATGLQMLLGAAAQAILVGLTGEHLDLASVSSSSWWALLYLAIFGSLLGFTCYGWLLTFEPPTRVSTYAFVNPVVAMILGVAIGGEDLTLRTVVAMVVIVAAVVVLLRSSSSPRARSASERAPAQVQADRAPSAVSDEHRP